MEKDLTSVLNDQPSLLGVNHKKISSSLVTLILISSQLLEDQFLNLRTNSCLEEMESLLLLIKEKPSIEDSFFLNMKSMDSLKEELTSALKKERMEES